MKTLIKGAQIVNEGRSFLGSILIEDDRISQIIEGNPSVPVTADHTINAVGCYALPGVIDEHVHFRDPGLTDKADIESESRAAAYGGVTSYFDMPNTVPQTTTMAALEDKYAHAAKTSHVNYAFFLGATNENVGLFKELAGQDGTSEMAESNGSYAGIASPHRPHSTLKAVKLFMGSSTGNMLVDKQEALESIFRTCAALGLVVMTHCEDTDIINHNMAEAQAKHGADPNVSLHPLIRSEEACYRSSALAVSLAKKYGTHLHIAHISTAKELELLDPEHGITGEACVPHLLFSQEDYAKKGALIKCNPAIKTAADRTAIRRALSDGRITTIGTDHAPHLLSQKQGGAAKAVSGMPMLQFSLVAMLGLADEKVVSIERVVELMAHNPARLFHVRERGFLRKGYKADIAIVRPNAPWTLKESDIQSKCGWSPLTGTTFNWRVEHTISNGQLIFSHGEFDEKAQGEPIAFA